LTHQLEPSKAAEQRMEPYFQCAVLGGQLLLQLRDLAAGVLPQLGEAALESLDIFYKLGDFPLLCSQFYFQAGPC